MSKRSLWICAVFGLAAMWPSSVFAKKESPALLLEKAAELLFQAGQYSDAAKKFLEVIHRYKEPEDVILTARWNLGRCYEELGNDEAALEAFLEFQRNAKRPSDKKDAEAKILEIRKRLRAELTLEVEPAGATISVDGQAVGLAPLPKPLLLDPGEHKVECTKEGFRPRSEEISLKAKEKRSVRLVLEEMSGIVALSPSGPLPGPVEVEVDGAIQYEGNLPTEVPVPAGRHRITVRAKGSKEAFEKEVEVADGGRSQVEVVLSAPLPPKGVAAEPSRPEVTTEVSLPSPRERGISLDAFASFGTGFARYEGSTARTHANLEFGAGLSFQKFSWIEPVISLVASVEAPLMLLVRPGLRFHLGGLPLYLRTCGQAMVLPVKAGGILLGVGADIALLGHVSLILEADASLWPSAISFVPVEFRVGVGYAF